MTSVPTEVCIQAAGSVAAWRVLVCVGLYSICGCGFTPTVCLGWRVLVAVAVVSLCAVAGECWGPWLYSHYVPWLESADGHGCSLTVWCGWRVLLAVAVLACIGSIPTGSERAKATPSLLRPATAQNSNSNFLRETWQSRDAIFYAHFKRPVGRYWWRCLLV